MIMPVLNVQNVDASIAFYVEKLGFEKSMSLDGPDGKTAWAMVNLGDSMFGLSRADSAIGGEGVMFMVYIPEKADIDEYYEEVQGKGAVLEGEIKTEYWGDRTFTLKDPDGYMLSLCKTVQQVDVAEIWAAMSEAQ